MELTKDQRVARARSALAYYHNAATSWYSYNYGFKTFDQLVDRMNTIAPGFFDLFGKSVGYAQPTLSETEVREAMERVVRTTEGFPPTRASEVTIFYDALSGPLVNWSLSRWTTTVATATVETAKQAAVIGGIGSIAYLAALGVVAVVLATRRAG